MRAKSPIVVIGDALLDTDLDGVVGRLCPDAPAPVVDGVTRRARPGGAALAAYLVARTGTPTVLIAPLAPCHDPASAEVAALLTESGARYPLRLVPIPLGGRLARKTRVRAGGRTLLRLDDDQQGAIGEVPAEAHEAIAGAEAILVSDYGRGTAALPDLRHHLEHRDPRVPLVWDPRVRGARPVSRTTMAAPNMAEVVAAAGLADEIPTRTADLLRMARRAGAAIRDAWRSASVCVTLGSRGALLVRGTDDALYVPPPTVSDSDPCGAGDQFAAACAMLLAEGAVLSEAVTAAVHAASGFVADGGAAALGEQHGDQGVDPPTGDDEVLSQLAAVRARGGRIVATGGCFDLFHAGHLSTLRAARGLGDFLVVCLNSDASIRRLKGPNRPVTAQADRVAILRALDCVDSVAVFDEDTPASVLERLRPDIWVKGGDYEGAELAERHNLEQWGGQIVTVPYVAGRSTTRLVESLGLSRTRRADPDMSGPPAAKDTTEVVDRASSMATGAGGVTTDTEMPRATDP